MNDPLKDRWLAFYLGRDFDHRGRTVEFLWVYSNRSLEAVHDYIQWLFPLPTPSPYNPDAPLLTDERAEAARQIPEMRRRLITSLQRMLGFYGFDLRHGDDGAPTVSRSGNHDERVAQWVSDGNHNYLRISRILGCLRRVGLEAEASAFLGALEELYAEEEEERPGPENRIGARTLSFWRGALKARPRAEEPGRAGNARNAGEVGGQVQWPARSAATSMDLILWPSDSRNEASSSSTSMASPKPCATSIAVARMRRNWAKVEAQRRGSQRSVPLMAV